MTPPHREYWRVWSDERHEFLFDHSSECDHYAVWAVRSEAQKEADKLNTRIAEWRADWRPVHCREVVIDG